MTKRIPSMWDATPPQQPSWVRPYLWFIICCTAAMFLALIWIIPVFTWASDASLATKLGATAMGVLVTMVIAPAAYLVVRDLMRWRP